MTSCLVGFLVLCLGVLGHHDCMQQYDACGPPGSPHLSALLVNAPMVLASQPFDATAIAPTEVRLLCSI